MSGSAHGLVAVVLAAGHGTRLRPLTLLRPKALCPVANVPLLDLALEQAAPVAAELAVNAHAHHEHIVRHLAGRPVHVSVELPEPLGTAGALGRLRDLIAGRPVLVLNADAWRPGTLRSFVESWDGDRVRLLTVEDPARPDFGTRRYAGAALLPWRTVRSLEPVPSGLYEVCWSREPLELFPHGGPFVDCGTPSDYLTANLVANGGRSVVGPGATVLGRIEQSVVWPGAVVHRHERLVRAIRADGGVTVSAEIAGSAPGEQVAHALGERAGPVDEPEEGGTGPTGR